MADMNIVAIIRSYGRIAVLTLFSLLFNRYAAFILGIYAYSLIILLLGGLGGVLEVTEIESIMVLRRDEIRGVLGTVAPFLFILLFQYDSATVTAAGSVGGLAIAPGVSRPGYLFPDVQQRLSGGGAF
jgi:hypothetical protein